MASSTTRLTTPTKLAPKKKSQWAYYYDLTRLSRFPVGSVLVFCPSACALTMAARSVNYPLHDLLVQTLYFAIGSTILHCTICVLNDLLDRDIDARIERTKHRPLAAGHVPVAGATLLLLAFTVASVSVLAMGSETVFLWGIVDIFPLHALYPLMKRWTYWPQAWLGFATNWSYFVGWIAVAGTMNYQVAVTFFLGTVCWTIVYDTTYACEDRKEDVGAGVKSTALLFGSWVRPILGAFAMTFVACIFLAGVFNEQGTYFFLISVGGPAIFFCWHFLTWDPDNDEDCEAKFVANGNLGFVIWLGIFLDYYFKVVYE